MASTKGEEGGGGGGGGGSRKEEDWKCSEWSMEKVGDWGEN